MAFRFVHAADLHLDSPFTGIRETAPQVADVLRRATFDAYDRLIQLCIDRRAGALLVAGDIFDSADRSLTAQIRFVRGLERLRDAGIGAFICHGNHDPLDGWGAHLALPSNAHQFGETAEALPVDPTSPTGPLVCGVSYPHGRCGAASCPSFRPASPGASPSGCCTRTSTRIPGMTRTPPVRSTT